jgi:hypothetical protein
MRSRLHVIFLDEPKFSFLNGNLVVRRRRRPICIVQPGTAHLEKVQVNTKLGEGL